jgi:pimeloyl-ACP methyl ester carboxylesterase
MTVVFLHPVGLDGACYQFLTAEPLRGAVRYDCLWHGRRGKPGAKLTIEAMAADVVTHVSGVLDLVGVSMGGHIAQRIAMTDPGRVRSLLITSGLNGEPATGPGGDGDGHSEIGAMVMRLGMAGTLPWALKRWFTERALAQADHPGVAYVRDRLLRNSAEQFAAGWDALAAPRPGPRQQAAALTMPCTVLHSVNDNSTLDSRRQLADRLKQGRLVTCQGPHMVQLEEPEAFQDAVLDHLAWVASLDS